jgi:carbamoyl-phosphate synthase large subunit
MEVVRDKKDNCIIICSIENLDPMGIHTGDSITIAPALTLTDKEYQMMRDASLAVLREIGVETGGSNVQFAVNPKDGRLIIIEMNPRVSRSSALGVEGDRLPDRQGRGQARGRLHARRDRQRHHRRRDAGVVRADHRLRGHENPRFAFEKFPGADATLTTSMKSVGEAMAIGRTFQESLQKALRSLETGLTGLDEITLEGLGQGDDKNAIAPRSARPPRTGSSRSRRRCGSASPMPRSIPPARSIRGSWRRSRHRRHRGRIRQGLPKTAGRPAAEGDGLLRRPLGKLTAATDEVTKSATRSCGRCSSASTPARPEFASRTAYMYSSYEDAVRA